MTTTENSPTTTADVSTPTGDVPQVTNVELLNAVNAAALEARTVAQLTSQTLRGIHEALFNIAALLDSPDFRALASAPGASATPPEQQVLDLWGRIAHAVEGLFHHVTGQAPAPTPAVPTQAAPTPAPTPAVDTLP